MIGAKALRLARFARSTTLHCTEGSVSSAVPGPNSRFEGLIDSVVAECGGSSTEHQLYDFNVGANGYVAALDEDVLTPKVAKVVGTTYIW